MVFFSFFQFGHKNINKLTGILGYQMGDFWSQYQNRVSCSSRMTFQDQICMSKVQSDKYCVIETPGFSDILLV